MLWRCYCIIIIIESSRLQIRIQPPHSATTCLRIPKTDVCLASLLFVWPQKQKGLSCFCPVVNSNDGRAVFHSCVQGCSSDFMPYLTKDEQVCIPRQSSSINGTQFLFMCSTDPCTGNCFVKTIIATHRVLFAGTYIELALEIMIKSGPFMHNILKDLYICRGGSASFYRSGISAGNSVWCSARGGVSILDLEHYSLHSVQPPASISHIFKWRQHQQYSYNNWCDSRPWQHAVQVWNLQWKQFGLGNSHPAYNRYHGSDYHNSKLFSVGV